MSEKPKPGQLNAQQVRFCQEYVIDLNGKQAAIRAGYSENGAEVQASRLLTNVNVKQYVDQLKKQRAERAQITADYVLATTRELINRCMQAEPVMVRKDGESVQMIDENGNHVWKFDANGANRAIELLGKHLKLFNEKVDHTHEHTHKLKPLTARELKEAIEKDQLLEGIKDDSHLDQPVADEGAIEESKHDDK